jgi:hypothetical protein
MYQIFSLLTNHLWEERAVLKITFPVRGVHIFLLSLYQISWSTHAISTYVDTSRVFDNKF